MSIKSSTIMSRPVQITSTRKRYYDHYLNRVVENGKPQRVTDRKEYAVKNSIGNPGSGVNIGQFLVGLLNQLQKLRVLYELLIRSCWVVTPCVIYRSQIFTRMLSHCRSNT